MPKIARCQTSSREGSWWTNGRVALCSAIRIYIGENTRFYRVLAAPVEIKRAFRARLIPFRSFQRVHIRLAWMYFIDVEHFNRIRSSRERRSVLSKSCPGGTWPDLRFLAWGSPFLDAICYSSSVKPPVKILTDCHKHFFFCFFVSRDLIINDERSISVNQVLTTQKF